MFHRADLPYEVVAIDDRHADVAQDGVRPPCTKLLQCLLGAARLGHFGPRDAQRIGRRTTTIRLVVDQQQAEPAQAVVVFQCLNAFMRRLGFGLALGRESGQAQDERRALAHPLAAGLHLPRRADG